jgi:hypothetical protein
MVLWTLDTYMFQFHCLPIKNHDIWIFKHQPQKIVINVKVFHVMQRITEIKLKTEIPRPVVVQYLQNGNIKSHLVEISNSRLPLFHLILFCTFPSSQDNREDYPIQFFSNVFARVESVYTERDTNTINIILTVLISKSSKFVGIP